MATKLARRMVCDWGMSDLGFVAFGANQDHIFLGKEIARDQNYSESTAQRIDTEIKRIIDQEYARAQGIIEKHRKALDVIAAALLEHETIEGDHVREIVDFGEIRSEVAGFDGSVLKNEKDEDSQKDQTKKKTDLAAEHKPKEGLSLNATD